MLKRFIGSKIGAAGGRSAVLTPQKQQQRLQPASSSNGRAPQPAGRRAGAQNGQHAPAQNGRTANSAMQAPAAKSVNGSGPKSAGAATAASRREARGRRRSRVMISGRVQQQRRQQMHAQRCCRPRSGMHMRTWTLAEASHERHVSKCSPSQRDCNSLSQPEVVWRLSQAIKQRSRKRSQAAKAAAQQARMPKELDILSDGDDSDASGSDEGESPVEQRRFATASQCADAQHQGGADVPAWAAISAWVSRLAAGLGLLACAR